ncbi:3-dehydroquinate synthase [bacterium]|nr:3-dehydroquinate synthase [bacterium]
MITLDVHTGGGSYPVVIGTGSLTRLPELLERHCPGRTVAIISDERVAGLYGQGIREMLESAGTSVHLYHFSPGENAKNSGRLNDLYTWLIETGIRRDDGIIALGGGVTGDLAGFAAATYLRGVPLIQVPTSLLAMVDSSVGGKTGINHPLGKNLIGAFYSPRFVLIDPSLLTTLHPREMTSGLAETVKYGLICDPQLYALLEQRLERIASLEDSDAVSHAVQRCCALKAEVVSGDERENGPRRILNFGHTLGHALEAETGYSIYRHGEAIVWGMRWACFISWQRGCIPEELFLRTERLLTRLIVPPLPADITANALAGRMLHDKKQSSAGLSLVLVTGIGRVRIEPVTGHAKLTERWLAHVTA